VWKRFVRHHTAIEAQFNHQRLILGTLVDSVGGNGNNCLPLSLVTFGISADRGA